MGDLTTLGIHTAIQGWMNVDKAVLGTPNALLLQMKGDFRYDWASDSAVVDPAVTAHDPWNDLFGMNGFSADSVKVAVRADHQGPVTAHSAERSDTAREGPLEKFGKGMLLADNVPLFGKSGFSLTLYLPEVTPQESDRPPEWFEGAQLYLQMSVDGKNLTLRAQGDLAIRIRKDGVPAPASYDQIRDKDYDHLTFSVAGDVAIRPPRVNVNLTGQVQALDSWHPLGLQWLTIQQLAIVLNVGTTPEGNAKIGFGLVGAIVLGTGPGRLDLEAFFLFGVKTLKVFPWATANIDGFPFQTDRGLRTDDLTLLAEFLAGRSLGVSDAALASLPKLAISDLEISYSKVDNT